MFEQKPKGLFPERPKQRYSPDSTIEKVIERWREGIGDLRRGNRWPNPSLALLLDLFLFHKMKIYSINPNEPTLMTIFRRSRDAFGTIIRKTSMRHPNLANRLDFSWRIDRRGAVYNEQDMYVWQHALTPAGLKYGADFVHIANIQARDPEEPAVWYHRTAVDLVNGMRGFERLEVPEQSLCIPEEGEVLDMVRKHLANIVKHSTYLDPFARSNARRN